MHRGVRASGRGQGRGLTPDSKITTPRNCGRNVSEGALFGIKGVDVPNVTPRCLEAPLMRSNIAMLRRAVKRDLLCHRLRGGRTRPGMGGMSDGAPGTPG